MGGHALDDKEFTVAVLFLVQAVTNMVDIHTTHARNFTPIPSNSISNWNEIMKPFVLTNVMQMDEEELNNQISQYRDFVSQELPELDDLG